MKKRKKINLLLVALICAVQISKGQFIDSVNRNLLVKNIISYHFKYTPDFELNINGNLLENNSYFFYDLWPEPKDSLIMEVENINVDYPKSNYKIYHIIKRGIQFFGDTSKRQYDFTYFLFDHDYLIAIDPERKKIKFISGNFFLTPIASDFSLDRTSPPSFYPFLKIRYFNMNLKNIKFHKSKKGKFLFTAFSSIMNRDMIIWVDEYNFDLTGWQFKERLPLE